MYKLRVQFYTRLQYFTLQIAPIDGIYKLEVSKYMTKVHKNDLLISAIITFLTFIFYPQCICTKQKVLVQINPLCKQQDVAKQSNP